jgi:hypothetical protein
VGLIVDGQNALAIDLSVDLSGRKGGVTQKFLNLAEIGTGCEKVRRKGVAKRVRRCRLGKG